MFWKRMGSELSSWRYRRQYGNKGTRPRTAPPKPDTGGKPPGPRSIIKPSELAARQEGDNPA